MRRDAAAAARGSTASARLAAQAGDPSTRRPRARAVVRVHSELLERAMAQHVESRRSDAVDEPCILRKLGPSPETVQVGPDREP